MSKKFFITTPIYYTNDIPHIGHAYASLIADFYSRQKRLLGYEVKFSTGVDENSQKALQKAEEKGMDISDYLDNMAYKHKNVWENLDISYTDFIRTTQEDHKNLVQEVLQESYENGDIYQGEYEGYYCVGCEAFKKESDLTEDGLCPDHLKKPDFIKEKNYFFKLSKYQDDLLRFYEENPSFVQPNYRFNELINFVKEGLEDFSVSRQTNKFGIPLPFDNQQVTYVWYDALFNYVTVCKNGDEKFWPADFHVVGKDIARFHAIYWPAMLLSAGYELPKNVISTGFFTVDGQKMSKSLGNVVEPVNTVQNYGRDALLLYLLYDISIGRDGDFGWERFFDVYNNMLLGGWGNLVSRVSKLSQKNNINKVQFDMSIEKEFLDLAKDLGYDENLFVNMFENGFDKNKIDEYFDTVNINSFIRDWYDIVQLANKFIEEKKPWELLKQDENQGKQTLCFLVYIIKNIAIITSPFLTEGFEKTKQSLGTDLLDFDTSETINDVEERFNSKSFDVNLSPKFLYQKL
ncbi:methionine--tRNA ligase [Candidatus Absconditicoccus praedator]|uniref:methionine--tRNA ligase n=1 Tax=Candidatus Absconditicoccus praedator TaxID=2735562 RepID=UPI001E555376|nr:methionine--tRNA ligase [Candidatus Absconditicoccus praedator]UFX83044.1 methionine--tRNA ligase [Candidatus Absconditicoccus praedator]